MIFPKIEGVFMKKILVSASLLSIVALVSFEMYAMDVLPTWKIEIANRTNGDIKVINGEELITIPKRTNKSFMIKSLHKRPFEMGEFISRKDLNPKTIISTNQGDFVLWVEDNLGNGARGPGSLIIRKADLVMASPEKLEKVSYEEFLDGTTALNRIQNPIITFEQGKTMPTIKEHAGH